MTQPKLPESLRHRDELIAIAYVFDGHAEAQSAIERDLPDDELREKSVFLLFINTGRPGVEIVEAYNLRGERVVLDPPSAARVLPRGSPWAYRVASAFVGGIPEGPLSVLVSLRGALSEQFVWPRKDLN